MARLRCLHRQASLTQSAWYNNIEAGMFFTDEELEGSGQALEL